MHRYFLTHSCRCVTLHVVPLQANLNSDNIRLMSAMLCAALYPNVVQVEFHYRC